MLVYSKNDIPIRKAKPFQPQKTLITHSNDSMGAILLSQRQAKKHEETKMVELERLKLYEPETQQKKYVEIGASTRMSRKNTGLSLRQRTKIEGSKVAPDFQRDFDRDFKGPSTTTFSSPWGEFKGIFLADWSEQYRAVLNLILLDWFGLHEPFYGPGQCF